MGVIRNYEAKFQSKLKDKGPTVMLLGYDNNHLGNVFRFLKIQNKKCQFGNYLFIVK
jgi:hypothetical protein